MINNEKINDKTNYGDVYLRCVIVGFLGFLRNRFNWTNISEEQGEYLVKLPIHYPLTGDNRYIMDAFFDDVPDTRVNMNTDQVPRGVLTLTSWKPKNDEFTNPNVWLNITKEIDDDLIQTVAQVKAVPMNFVFTLETVFNNEIDLFKSWEAYMKAMYMYKYFTYDYKRLPIKANFNFISDTDNAVARDETFGTIKEQIKTSYTFEINTYFPIFDEPNEILSNKKVQWNNEIFESGANTNLPPMTQT